MKAEVLGREIEIDTSLVEEGDEEVRLQLSEYSRGERRSFDIDISFPEGFTGKVMRSMSRISYGETRSYGELAGELWTSPVAVGQACGRNPLPVIVPCHRVVGKDSTGGYQYPGLKEKLLRLESGT